MSHNKKLFRIPGPLSLLALIACLAFLLFPVVKRSIGPCVRVSSCGGNFNFLCEFNRRFTALTGIHVDYTAAPIQFLLGRILNDQDKTTQVLVGRAGPGWQVLEKRGLLYSDPCYFAVDPLVILTAPGNPANIETISDLGRPGVKVGRSQPAMRPKGMCPTHFLEVLSAGSSGGPFPGLVNRVEANITLEDLCGRTLPRALIEGRIDAALSSRTVAFQPPLKGDSFIDIAPELFIPMKKCRSSLPQMAGLLKFDSGQVSEEAALYLKHLQGALGAEIAAKFGYIHCQNAAYKSYGPILSPPKIPRMAPRMLAMSKALLEAGYAHAAATFYAKTFCLFGPSRQDGEALLGLAKALKMLEKPDRALAILEYGASLYPVSGRKEWIDTIDAMAAGKKNPTMKWRREIDARITAVGSSEAAGSGVTGTQLLTRLHDLIALDPSPGQGEHKGGKRQVALTRLLIMAGLYDTALKEALKVQSLMKPSPFRGWAQALAGAAMLSKSLTLKDSSGGPTARTGWKLLGQSLEDIPPDPAGLWNHYVPLARNLFSLAPSLSDSLPDDGCGSGGAGFGMALRQAGQNFYSTKEWLKVIAGIYSSKSLSDSEILAMIGDRLPDFKIMNHLPEGALQPDLVHSMLTGQSLESGLLLRDPRKSISFPGATPVQLSRLSLAEWMIALGMNQKGQPLMEYFKVIFMAPKPDVLTFEPKCPLGPIETAAMIRAGQWLMTEGKPDAAMRLLDQAVKRGHQKFREAARSSLELCTREAADHDRI